MQGILGQRDSTVNYTIEDATEPEQPLIMFHSDPNVSAEGRIRILCMLLCGRHSRLTSGVVAGF